MSDVAVSAFGLFHFALGCQPGLCFCAEKRIIYFARGVECGTPSRSQIELESQQLEQSWSGLRHVCVGITCAEHQATQRQHEGLSTISAPCGLNAAAGSSCNDSRDFHCSEKPSCCPQIAMSVSTFSLFHSVLGCLARGSPVWSRIRRLVCEMSSCSCIPWKQSKSGLRHDCVGITCARHDAAQWQHCWLCSCGSHDLWDVL